MVLDHRPKSELSSSHQTLPCENPNPIQKSTEKVVPSLLIQFLFKASAGDFDLTKKFPTEITSGRLQAPSQLTQPYACLYGHVGASDSKFAHKVVNSPCCRPATPASREGSCFWASNRDGKPTLPSLPSPPLPCPHPPKGQSLPSCLATPFKTA